ncbi:MAG TPA: hypothetical protein VFA18_16500 [Gemmataceae bacterium]|nr:hypothetical protein [Gemmataceae bacterium]
MNLPIQVPGVIRDLWAWPVSGRCNNPVPAVVPQGSTACHCTQCLGSAENCGSAGCYCNGQGMCVCN